MSSPAVILGRPLLPRTPFSRSQTSQKDPPRTQPNSPLGYTSSLRAGKIKPTTHKRMEGLTDTHERTAILLAAHLFGRTGSSSLSARQQKVSDYIIGRMENDVPLQQVLREDYVRRNCSQAEVEQIVSSPEFIEIARVRFGESFSSEEFKL